MYSEYFCVSMYVHILKNLSKFIEKRIRSLPWTPSLKLKFAVASLSPRQTKRWQFYCTVICSRHKFTCFGIFSFVTYLAASRRPRQENHSGGTKKLVKDRQSRICCIIFIAYLCKDDQKKRKAFLQEWHYYNNIDDMTLKWFRIVTMSHFKYLSNFYLCSLCIVKPCSHSVPVSRKFLDGCIFWHFSSSV